MRSLQGDNDFEKNIKTPNFNLTSDSESVKNLQGSREHYFSKLNDENPHKKPTLFHDVPYI
jgi:hypothetical protein